MSFANAGDTVLTFDNLQLSNARNMQLTALPDAVGSYVEAATAENTRRAYRSDLAHFRNWGGTIPSSQEQVAAYLAAHAGTLKAATLKRRIVSIGLAHTAQGYVNPCTTELVRITLRGIWRVHGASQRQVAPTLREDVLAMVHTLSGIKGMRDRAVILIGFAGAFRRSELVALEVGDLEFVPKGLLVTIRRSKTDQAGVGRKVAIPFARGLVCPVEALLEWLRISGIAEGPIFRPVTRHGQISKARLSPHAVASIIKERARQLGLDPTRYAGHSLRAGLITSCAALGVSNWKIKAQSGHRTDAMIGRYVRDVDLFNGNAVAALL